MEAVPQLGEQALASQLALLGEQLPATCMAAEQTLAELQVGTGVVGGGVGCRGEGGLHASPQQAGNAHGGGGGGCQAGKMGRPALKWMADIGVQGLREELSPAGLAAAAAAGVEGPVQQLLGGMDQLQQAAAALQVGGACRRVRTAGAVPERRSILPIMPGVSVPLRSSFHGAHSPPPAPAPTLNCFAMSEVVQEAGSGPGVPVCGGSCFGSRLTVADHVRNAKIDNSKQCS